MAVLAQLIGHWPLNGDANDNGGGGKNGTATNVTFMQSKLAMGGSMVGTGYIEMASPMTVNGTSTFTLSCWINPNAVNVAYQRIITQKSTSASTTEFGAQIVLNNNKITAFASNVTTTFDAAIDPGTASVGVWYFITATYDGNDVKLYVNGVLANTAAYSAGTKSAGNNTNVWDIGAFLQASTYYGKLNGIIDDVRLYNTVLTPAQIKNLYIDGVQKL